MKPALILAATSAAAWSAIDGKYRQALIFAALATGTAAAPHRKQRRDRRRALVS